MIHLQYIGIGLLGLAVFATIPAITSWAILSIISWARHREVEKFQGHFVDHLLLGLIIYAVMAVVYITGGFIHAITRT